MSDFFFCIVLSSQVGAVVTRIGEKYREAALALVAKAYSTIRIADLAVYLGQTEAGAGAQVATLGWSQESGVVSYFSFFPRFALSSVGLNILGWLQYFMSCCRQPNYSGDAKE